MAILELEMELEFVCCPVLVIEYVDEDDTDIVKLGDTVRLLVAKGVELTEPEATTVPDCRIDTDRVGVTVAVFLPLCVAFNDLLDVCVANTV